MVRASISDSWGEGNGLSNNLSQKRQLSSKPSGNGAKRGDTQGKRRSVMLMDLDILDCPICFEALTIPIFQCDNGHLACSSCCPKLSNKCPACALPVGYNRCRAMESVLESAFVPCPNAKLGCTKKVFYGKESTHQKECTFSQCSCPGKDSGSYKDCYDSSTHRKRSRVNMFSCGISHWIRLNINDKISVIKIEYTKSLLFALQCFREPYGVYITVSCITPTALEVGEFSYHLSYTVDGQTMSYKSIKMRGIQELSFRTPRENFMLIPHSLLRGELLELKLCIQNSNQ